MKRFFLIFLCNALFLSSYTQNELLTWKDHFSYKNVICVTGTNDAVYAATSLGAFRVSLEDNSITRINKANDLSDIGISWLEGIPERDMLLVAAGGDNARSDINMALTQLHVAINNHLTLLCCTDAVICNLRVSTGHGGGITGT